MHLHFVTGRLAEHALRREVKTLAAELDFPYSIDVLPITVAALMTPKWIARHIAPPPETTRIILPGYCDGDLSPLKERVTAPIEIGPRDLRRLPEYLGGKNRRDEEYGGYDIEIIAEINHAPRMTLEQILAAAKKYQADGADVIDVGCEPGEPWSRVGETVAALVDLGLRVSIDSLNPREIAPAVAAGAELVLSVNSSNRDAAADWGCEVVVIPDLFETLGGLDDTVEQLAAAGVPLRIDPILEPIGCGFAASLGRYLEVRRRYPDVEMMMGIGNLTELTDADSAGVNMLLLGVCQEQAIRSVLTTEVINWSRTSVAECDLARRAVFWSVEAGTPPKHVEPQLIMLRDVKLTEFGGEELGLLADKIKDNNFRIFAEQGELHLMTGGLYLRGDDPFELLKQLIAANPKHLDASHAFYLGYEMCKAVTALTLGKQYTQDEALNWGMLTRPETRHR